MSHDITLDRGLPCDYEAERMILGVIILDNLTLSQALDKLMPWSFFRPSHRLIFEAMLKLECEGTGIDPLTLQNKLGDFNQLDQVGGPAFIASLFDGVPRFSNIEAYVNRVEECSLRRQQIAAGNQAIQLAYDFEQPAKEQLNAAQKVLCDVQAVDSRASWQSAGDLGYEVLSEVEERIRSGRTMTGMATGFYEFDSITCGLQRGELIVIGGRPKMGKTGFVGSLILNAAGHEANRCEDGESPVIGFFSIEMARKRIIERWQCSMAEVNAMRVRNGMVGKDELRRLTEATNQLSGFRIEVDDTAIMTPMTMRFRLRQLQQQRGRLDLAVVDYLQMMTPDKRSDSLVREVSEITRALKAMAKDFNVPIVALASLSRKCEDRVDKRPVASDLRESGNIESDADVIAFIYRDAVYNANADPHAAELIVRSQRNGPVGTVNLVFQGRFTRFENVGEIREGAAASALAAKSVAL